MIAWLCLLFANAVVGDASERPIIHFGSQNCIACLQVQPVIDQLHSEGLAIR